MTLPLCHQAILLLTYKLHLSSPTQLYLYCVNVCAARYQAPGSAGTFYDADTSTAEPKQTDTKTKKQRIKSHLSAEIRSKFPDFPVMEGKRDRLKQRDKAQQSKNKKAAAVEVVEKPTLSSSSTVLSDLGRTGGAEEKMDVLQ